jgi:hypothetical protein
VPRMRLNFPPRWRHLKKTVTLPEMNVFAGAIIGKDFFILRRKEVTFIGILKKSKIQDVIRIRILVG